MVTHAKTSDLADISTVLLIAVPAAACLTPQVPSGVLKRLLANVLAAPLRELWVILRLQR